MKVTGFSFYLGIVATIMIGITFFSVIIYDVVRHRVHDTVKYLFFVFSRTYKIKSWFYILRVVLFSFADF